MSTIGKMFSFVLSYDLIHHRLKDFYRVKLRVGVVCTVVLAISLVCNMYMPRPGCTAVQTAVFRA